MTKILSIDIGTSRIKCALFSETGKMSSLQSRFLPRTASPDRQDAEAWFQILCELLQNISKSLLKQLEAVIITGNMHALLGIDKDGNCVAPARLWSDNHAETYANRLNQEFGKEFFLREFGNPAIPIFTLPKMLQMKAETPELYHRSICFLQSKDYIAYRLTGRLHTDPSDASGTLMMNATTQRYHSDFLQQCGISEDKMPEIILSTAICGTIHSQASTQTGLLAGTPVIMGCGDLASAAVGSGVDSNTLSLTLGTSGQLLAAGLHGQGKKIAGKLFLFSHADPALELYLGSVPAGGFCFDWLAKKYHITIRDFFDLAAQKELTADLPLFFPYILGRGAPSMDYHSNGGWRGLNASHTDAALCRGAIFGTLCPLRICADLLEKNLGKKTELSLQALACREKVVQETASALFTQQKKLPTQTEASLLGSAVIGMTALHIYSSITEASTAMIQTTPINLPHTTIAEKLFQRFQKEDF